MIQNLKYTCLSIFLIAHNGIGLIAQHETEIDNSKLSELIEFSKETFTDEIILAHKNKVVRHWKNQNCDSVYFNTASMVKSWTGLVVGTLVDKGLINSEDDLVCNYIPEWTDGCTQKVTIKNLLTMSAGFARRSGARGILAENDMNDYVINTELDTVPTIRFGYSNESVQLLGILIENVTKKSANDYFHEVLFDPLEMDSTSLGRDLTGNDMVFGGARTTVEDAAKIGMLMTNNGVYLDKQIVSENWIEKSIQPSENASYYGYLWWLDYNSGNNNFAATGDFGQMTIIFPELDLVYVRRQSCNKEKSGNMTWMGPDFLKLISSIIVE